MIKAIILDCFGVLYAQADQGSASPSVTGTDPHRAELTQLQDAANYGLISREEYVAQAAELDGRPPQAHTVAKGLVRNQPLLDYAAALRLQYKIGMLSNISVHTMDQFFDATERAQLFDDVVISSEVGMIKPHPEIFALACQRLGVDTSEAVMIDDIPANCDGARMAGMQAILYQNVGQVHRDLDKMLV